MSRELFLRVLDHLEGVPDIELSFDDGNRSDVDIALPALVERGLDATFFVLAGRLDDPWSLASRDLTDLRSAGMTLGSHGWLHVPWRGLSPEDTQRELVDARLVLELAGAGPVTRAALPLGRYDRTVLRALRGAGYEAVYTSDRFPARPESWLQARYSVSADDTLESVVDRLRARPGLAEARNLMASYVKRIR